jgi:ankyrin repeat protein
MLQAWSDVVTTGDVNAARRMVEEGVDVNAKDRYGQTALMLAALHGHTGLVELLIAQGADLDVTAKFGLSALMLAVVGGHTATASMLTRAGADLRLVGTGAPGFAGKTAYDLAVARGLHALFDELRPGP